MELGDPKQVVILSVMAVGALGFLGSRMIGRGGPAAAMAAAAQARTASVVKPVGDLAFSTDPFSHPRLAPPAKPTPATPTVVPPTFGSAGPSPLSGSLPSVGTLPVPGPLVAAKPLPTEATAKPIAKPATEAVTVALEGLAGASDVVAFLSVGGAESQPFRPGDRIQGKVRLLRVGDGAVVLSGPQGELTLEVGERKRI